MMKCSSCVTEIESGAAKCPHCGAEMGGDSASNAARRLKTDRSIRFYVMFGAAPIVMAVILVVFFFLE